jgi:AraC-like DNA-binding protein
MKEIPVYRIEEVTIRGNMPSFEVLTLEQAFNKAKRNIVGSHRHDFYESFLVCSGSGSISIDFVDYQLSAPLLLFLSPGCVHSWDKSIMVSGLTLRFTTEFMVSNVSSSSYSPELFIFVTIGGSPVIHLNEEQFDKFRFLGTMMESEYSTPRIKRDEALRSYLKLWLIESLRIAKEQGLVPIEGKGAPLTRRFLSLVESNFLINASVTDYAERLGVTPNHLCESVRRTINRSAGEIIRSRILIEAKRLLRHADMSVSEIAYHLNFEDPSYFARYFRKYCSVTPSIFRNKP